MSQSLTENEHNASTDKVTTSVLAITMGQSLVQIIMQKYLTRKRCSAVTTPSSRGYKKPGIVATGMEDRE